MFRKRALLLVGLLLSLGLSACHVVDENQSQISLARPASQLIARVEKKAGVVAPSIGLPHAMSKQVFMALPKYSLQSNNPTYTQNFAHQDLGCKWIGVAGQVFDQQQNPVSSVVVQLKGTMNGTPITELGMTGTARIYGPAGYELLLGSQPFNSSGALTIQLLDSQGKPLSAAVPINTYQDCQKNLILVNFLEFEPNYQYAMPFIGSSGPSGSR